ncbi:RNA polymerase sigma factor [Pseudogemmobacter humi]|uniref:Putative RNA polymerase sigma factor FecI n=1 Tax=Pseudogemmobacter humi TaxID=2483812 RepID=A0A3P5XQQ5_9RHOB|nr:RNA polymerase sigma factor [Pseudogemmobacter humi]VDC33948.1 putative RNA polymerase sigma factor FecI [Pseudogemmobacter humi]
MTRNRAEEIDVLFRSERAWMERRAARIAGPADAPDIVQNVFARLWNSACEQVALTPAWLGAALRNAAIDQYRSEKRCRSLAQRIVPEQYVVPIPDSEQIVLARDQLRYLERTLHALPERQRHVFLLNRAHGCSYDEIAAALGISYSTVEREIARALRSCRAALGDDATPEG